MSPTIQPQHNNDARRLGRRGPMCAQSRASHFTIIPLALAALLTLPTLARADWTLLTADFTTQKQLTINTWSPAQGLSATNDRGTLLTVPSRNIIRLASDRPPPPRPAAEHPGWRLTLRNGDVLSGEPAGINGQSLDFKLPDLGPISIPLKNIQTLAPANFDTKPISSTDKDVVLLANGDRTEGIVASIDADKLQLATGADGSGGTTDIATKLVRQLAFAGAAPARPVPTLSARLTFISGTILTVPLDPSVNAFSWTINDLSFNDPAGQSHKVPAGQLVSIDVLGGRVVYLSALDPQKDEQTSFLGTAWPTQIDKNILGLPLTVADTTYDRGLGVHTRSLLAFPLDGQFTTFKFRVGMDDSAAPHGEADVSVVLDGTVIWQRKGIRPAVVGSPAPDVIEVPIKGGKVLELHADPAAGAGKLDVLGRVDWLDAVLVRP